MIMVTDYHQLEIRIETILVFYDISFHIMKYVDTVHPY